MLQLDIRQITELVNAALDADLDRGALNAVMNRQYSSSLPKVTNPKQQLLVDLVKHNDAGTLTDGTVPLLQWLQAADTLANPRHAALVFRRYLEAAGTSRPGSPTAGTARGRWVSFLRSHTRLLVGFGLGLILGIGAMFAIQQIYLPSADRAALRDCRDRLVRVSAIAAKPSTDVDSLRRTVQTEASACLTTLQKETAR